MQTFANMVFLCSMCDKYTELESLLCDVYQRLEQVEVTSSFLSAKTWIILLFLQFISKLLFVFYIFLIYFF